MDFIESFDNAFEGVEINQKLLKWYSIKQM